jgi:threonine dehydrogenase-like Zn-dependent dehydrogenase
MAMGKIRLEPIITRHITMEEWREAFEALEAKREIKVMMYPNEKYRPK